MTYDDLLACIRREIRMRQNVYPRRVARGDMTTDEAERETALMIKVGHVVQHHRDLARDAIAVLRAPEKDIPAIADRLDRLQLTVATDNPMPIAEPQPPTPEAIAALQTRCAMNRASAAAKESSK